MFLFIDFQEIVIILVVVVILFGPNSLPEIARGLGTLARKFKIATEEIKSEILNSNEITSSLDEASSELNKSTNIIEGNISDQVNQVKDSLNLFDKRIKREDD